MNSVDGRGQANNSGRSFRASGEAIRVVTRAFHGDELVECGTGLSATLIESIDP